MMFSATGLMVVLPPNVLAFTTRDAGSSPPRLIGQQARSWMQWGLGRIERAAFATLMLAKALGY